MFFSDFHTLCTSQALSFVWSVSSSSSSSRINFDVYWFWKCVIISQPYVILLRCGRANENYRFESCLGIIVSLLIHKHTLLKILLLLLSLACLQIPDEHLNGCAVYPHPEHPVRTVLRPEGTGVPDTDFLLYVFTRSTDKCHSEVLETITVICIYFPF